MGTRNKQKHSQCWLPWLLPVNFPVTRYIHQQSAGLSSGQQEDGSFSQWEWRGLWDTQLVVFSWNPRLSNEKQLIREIRKVEWIQWLYRDSMKCTYLYLVFSFPVLFGGESWVGQWGVLRYLEHPFICVMYLEVNVGRRPTANKHPRIDCLEMFVLQQRE